MAAVSGSGGVGGSAVGGGGGGGRRYDFCPLLSFLRQYDGGDGGGREPLSPTVARRVGVSSSTDTILSHTYFLLIPPRYDRCKNDGEKNSE